MSQAFEVFFGDRRFEAQAGENLLNAAIRQGIELPFSCRAGSCHVCLLRSHKGKISLGSQAGLPETLLEKNYLLACQMRVSSDLQLMPAEPEDVFSYVKLLSKEMLAPDIVKLTLEAPHGATSFCYHAGQHINLRRHDGLVRTYSLASVPSLDEHLELHVKVLSGGLMGPWIKDVLNPGVRLGLQIPSGNCFYRSEFAEYKLLLAATGTGLAPLWGIVRDALHAGHKQPIYLYHGSRSREGLYMHQALLALAKQYPHFHYYPCLTGENALSDQDISVRRGRIQQLILQDGTDLSEHVTFICGHPEMVEEVKATVIQAQGHRSHIFSDAFTLQSSQLEHPATQEEKEKWPVADLEVWRALGEGKVLNQILHDFYDQVYKDPLLSPFFSVTQAHIVGKQYAFLKQIFTGEDVYFGELPRNAHHWMVISDDLFDHRAQLMEKSLEKFKVSKAIRLRFMQLENGFREKIVKAKPWPKIAFGKALPMEGYELIQLDAGGLCDGCGSCIEPEEEVRYHLRMGTVYGKCCETKRG